MASRQEEKEQRRREREEQEAAERSAAARGQRLRIVLGGLVALLVLAGAAYAITQAGGDGGGSSKGRKSVSDAAKVALPEPKTTNMKDAAKAAGCTLTNPKYEGAGHEERAFTIKDYKTNPPTSGAHFPTWYDDGIYEPGSTPELGQLVHTLEHGRIDVQYKKGTDPKVVQQLEAFLAEKTGYHLLLFENTTDMAPAVAATAWTHSLTCETVKPEMFDALRTFYQSYVDKGPEQVP
jgi:hypothetical protein